MEIQSKDVKNLLYNRRLLMMIMPPLNQTFSFIVYRQIVSTQPITISLSHTQHIRALTTKLFTN